MNYEILDAVSIVVVIVGGFIAMMAITTHAQPAARGLFSTTAQRQAVEQERAGCLRCRIPLGLGNHRAGDNMAQKYNRNHLMKNGIIREGVTDYERYVNAEYGNYCSSLHMAEDARPVHRRAGHPGFALCPTCGKRLRFGYCEKCDVE